MTRTATARLNVEFYTRDLTPIATQPIKFWADQFFWRDELAGAGQWTVNIQNTDPAVDLIDEDMLVRFVVDEKPVFTGIIEVPQWRKISLNRNGLYVTFGGSGHAARLNDHATYPEGGLGVKPYTGQRIFDYTNAAYNHAYHGWGTAVVTPANYGSTSENYGLPERFPDPTAEWIWSLSSAGTVAGGTNYFFKSFTVATTGEYELWAAADDQMTVFLDGIQMLHSSGAYIGKSESRKVTVTAGTHCLAARVDNLNALKAGFLCSLLIPNAASPTIVVNSGADWKVLGYPAVLAAMTVGEVVHLLRDEAIARGEDAPTINCTDILDSNGAAWSTDTTITVQIGDGLLDILQQLKELGLCDFRMDPAFHILNLYEGSTFQTSSGVTLTDSEIQELSFLGRSPKSTAALIRFDGGYTDTEVSGLVSVHGRRSGFVSLGGARTTARAQEQGQAVVAAIGDLRLQAICQAKFPAGSEPYLGSPAWGPGRTLIHPARTGSAEVESPVLAVTAMTDRVGSMIWEVELGDVIGSANARRDVILKSLASGAMGGQTRQASPTPAAEVETPAAGGSVKWSEAGPVVAMLGAPNSEERQVGLREMRVELETPSVTGDMVVDLLVNGVAVDTCTVPQGARIAYITLSGIIVAQRPGGYFQPEVTDPGSGANTITITVVYA